MANSGYRFADLKLTIDTQYMAGMKGTGATDRARTFAPSTACHPPAFDGRYRSETEKCFIARRSCRCRLI